MVPKDTAWGFNICHTPHAFPRNQMGGGSERTRSQVHTQRFWGDRSKRGHVRAPPTDVPHKFYRENTWDGCQTTLYRFRNDVCWLVSRMFII